MVTTSWISYFSNNTDSIEEVEVIDNFKISDHGMIIAKLSRDTIKDSEVKKLNFCTSAIPLFNLQKADADTWKAAREDFLAVEFKDDLSPEDLTEEIVKALEKVVSNNFKKSAPPSRGNKKSNNFIPREARCLLKRKLNAGRSLQKSTNPATRETLKNKIIDLEEALRKLIHKKKSYDENKARENQVKSPENFFKLVRKMLKKTEKIGLLKRNKENKKLALL